MQLSLAWPRLAEPRNLEGGDDVTHFGRSPERQCPRARTRHPARCTGHGRDRRQRRTSPGSRPHGRRAAAFGSHRPGEGVQRCAISSRRQRAGASAAGVARAVRAAGSGGGDTRHRGCRLSADPARRRRCRCDRSQRGHAGARRRVRRRRARFAFAPCAGIAGTHHVVPDTRASRRPVTAAPHPDEALAHRGRRRLRRQGPRRAECARFPRAGTPRSAASRRVRGPAQAAGRGRSGRV